MDHLVPVYYRGGDGRQPVREFIDALELSDQVVVDNQIDRLGMLSTDLEGPLAPWVSAELDGVFVVEVRSTSRCFHIICCLLGNLVVLLHATAGESISQADHELAGRRMSALGASSATFTYQ
jgi:hypothetical protein